MSASQIIRDRIFADLGITLGATFTTTIDEVISLGSFKLSPSMCGPVGPMFENLSVTISYVIADEEADIICIWYDYDYDHSAGGSNGYRMRTMLQRQGDLVTISR